MSLEARTGQYHCDSPSRPPPLQKKKEEISRQFFTQKHFGAGREAIKPSSPTAAGAAVPDGADGAAPGGTCHSATSHQPLSAGQCQLMTSKLLAALGT